MYLFKNKPLLDGFFVCVLGFLSGTLKTLWCGAFLVLNPFRLVSGTHHLQVAVPQYFGLVRALYSMCAAYPQECRKVDHTGQKLHLLVQSPWGTLNIELIVLNADAWRVLLFSTLLSH